MAVIRYWRGTGDDADGIFPAGTRGLDDNLGIPLCGAAAVAIAVAAGLAGCQTRVASTQWTYDVQDPAGSLFGQPDEDFWQNQSRPVVATLFQVLPYLPDPEEIPAGFLRGVPEEDAWVAPRPAPARAGRPLLFVDDSDAALVAAAVLAPDEDFWTSGVAPELATLEQRLPIGDPEEIPAGALFGQFDEDLWSPPIPAPAPIPRVAFSDDSDFAVTVASTLSPDEDFWSLGTPPTPAPSPRLYLPEADDVAVIAAASTIVDEEYSWTGRTIARPTALPAVFLDDSDFPSPTIDEDAWQPRPPPPATAPRLFLPDAEDAPAGFLRGQPDEDFWRNPTAPVPSSLYQRLPYLALWDPEEIPGLPQPSAVQPVLFLRGVQDAYSLQAALDAYLLRGLRDLYAVVGQRDSYSLVGRLEDPEGNILPFPQSFSVPLGDDVAIGLTIQTAGGSALDLTGGQLVFGLKKLLTDTATLLTKSSPASGIVITSAAAGLATLTLNAADTANLGDGPYAFDVQFISAAAKKSTVITGTLTLIQHPTR